MIVGVLTTCHTKYTWDNAYTGLLEMIVEVLTTCHTKYTWDNAYTGLLEMIVGVLTTCHTKYTWDKSICIFYLIEQHSKFLLHTL